MATTEEKLRLQANAGLPTPPTDTTFDARMAIAGEGPHAYEWTDKPHRLVYRLCAEIETAPDHEAAISDLRRQVEAERSASEIVTDALRQAQARALTAESSLSTALARVKELEDGLASIKLAATCTSLTKLGLENAMAQVRRHADALLAVKPDEVET